MQRACVVRFFGDVTPYSLRIRCAPGIAMLSAVLRIKCAKTILLINNRFVYNLILCLSMSLKTVLTAIQTTIFYIIHTCIL